MSTATATQTLGAALDQANANQFPEALSLVKLGTLLGGYDVTFSGLTSAAAQDITSAASFSHATINSGTAPPPGGTLPPILIEQSVRVIAGAAAAGVRVLADPGATATAGAAGSPGIALLSVDGKTITFEAAVTGFRIQYVPRPFIPLSSAFFNENPNPNKL
jgi:hypothetical protein